MPLGMGLVIRKVNDDQNDAGSHTSCHHQVITESDIELTIREASQIQVIIYPVVISISTSAHSLLNISP